mmetsp:Transcript_32582/g.69405  ORF Transcript_32582/g.69405 Transcript_32582/m.69405 type:complete len:201 (+) Transcript_32582:620-1222(+)
MGEEPAAVRPVLHGQLPTAKPGRVLLGGLPGRVRPRRGREGRDARSTGEPGGRGQLHVLLHRGGRAVRLVPQDPGPRGVPGGLRRALLLRIPGARPGDAGAPGPRGALAGFLRRGPRHGPSARREAVRFRVRPVRHPSRRAVFLEAHAEPELPRREDEEAGEAAILSGSLAAAEASPAECRALRGELVGNRAVQVREKAE